MEVKRTKNGDRALLVYLLDAQGVDESALESAIESVLAENEVGEVEKGATILDELETAKTVETVLTAENWRRSVRVGAVEGTIIASLYFAEQPKPLPVVELEEEEEEEGEEEPELELEEEEEEEGEEEPELEPEPLNLPGVVCEELAERFPGLLVGASSFVIKQDQRAFDFIVEESAIV